MTVKTNNIYGKISISDNVIAKYVAHVGLDLYGIVDIGTKDFPYNFSDILKGRPPLKKVKVKTKGDRMGIDVYVIAKYGVSVRAVAEAFKESVTYMLEEFSGMLVDYINVNVVDVRK